MKNFTIRSLGVLVLALFTGLAPGVQAAVVFTDTPSSVSNTYSGFITLSISGLTSGDSVVVQKFLDANTNGVIDAADFLVQQFTLTDGTNFVIGGVTNLNVPGDLNTTAGAITASLSYNNGDFMQNLVGRYFYKISSPVGHFPPQTNTFTVTNFPFAQNFTGSVVSNSAATTLSNAVVILFPPPRSGNHGPGQPLAGVVANNAGHYTISMPVGSYTLMAFHTNYVGDFNKAPVIALGSGSMVTTNLTLTNATASITGTIVDAANPAIVLPGVFMPVTSTNGLIAFAFSDTNGNYVARVTPNQWSLGSDDAGLIIHGYVGLSNNTNVVSPATGITLAFPRANALFYGTVSNALAIPLAAIDVNDSDNTSNLYSMDGYSDANGKYFVGAIATGNNDPWQLNVSSESLGTLTNDIISQPLFNQNGGTNLTAGLTVLQNLTALLATNLISGTLKDSSNNVITNVQITASATIGGQSYQPSVNTDNSGNFSLNVANGTWSLNVDCGGDQNSLPGNYSCPDTVVLNIANHSVVTNLVVQICSGLSITTSSPLPDGEVNIPYAQTFSASSCSPGFSWTNTSGSAALPPGLNFSGNGQLSGTPTANGLYTFTLQVTDGNNNMVSQFFSLTINNGVQVTTASLPDGTNGLGYSQQLQASGGQVFGGASPYSWSFTPGLNSLPPNLILATNGLISGTAATNGTFAFSVRVMDMVGSIADQPLSLTLDATNTVPPPPVGITSAGSQVLVYYPPSGSNFVLQTATNLAGPWMTASNGAPVISTLFTNTAPVQFYRLH